MAALTGDTNGAVEINKGTVSVNLAVLINTVKEQLSDAGFAIADRIPEVSATFTILQSEDLAKVQTLMGLIDGLSTWLPAVCLGLLVIAVLIARDRRRMVLVVGPGGGRLDAAAGGDPQHAPAHLPGRAAREQLGRRRRARSTTSSSPSSGSRCGESWSSP